MSMLEALLRWQLDALDKDLYTENLAHKARQRVARHGDAKRWSEALAQLPDCRFRELQLGDCVGFALCDPPSEALREGLMRFHPWRKGPFRLGDVRIDSEWRSDMKWRRLLPVTGQLRGARVLDVGCGNGYYGWRMIESGARCVVGVDRNVLWLAQHLAFQRYARDLRNLVLPLEVEELPAAWCEFDAVFSMGVLSHARDPLRHLQLLWRRLCAGGLLVLESLVLGEAGGELRPAKRYARMPNVWRLPGARRLLDWIHAGGFVDAKLLHLSTTRPEEQRSSAWMRFESLAEALDMGDSGRTVEGFPAPRRALVTARRP